MQIIKYNKLRHKEIIRECVAALRAGKTVVYTTDTSYGLAVDATNIKAIRKLYKVKGREFSKAVSVVVPGVTYAKKITSLDSVSSKLIKKFWPGALTLVLPLKTKNPALQKLSAGTNYLGLRMPDNQIALDLPRGLKKPITSTSANVAGMPDCYSVNVILKQYSRKKIKPDLIINAGKLPKQKPSTIVKVENQKIILIRKGPVKIKTNA